MSDYSELKRVASLAKNWSGEIGEDEWYTACCFDKPKFSVPDAEFIAKCEPGLVLALIADVEGLNAQHGRDSAELRSLCQARDDARKDRDQLKAEVARSTEREIMQLAEIEALRKEVASLKPSPIRTDRTTIGYTGCIICGQYTDHGGLQCPNLAARSLSIENQRVMPVEPIRAEHPLDALDRKLKP